jgi:integral membrane protein
MAGGTASGSGHTPDERAKEVRRVRLNVVLYRVMAYVTGVVLVILCFVGIPLQIAGHPAVASDVGVVHGILYIIYLAAAWLLARRLRLTAGPTVIMLLAGTIPILTFVVERWVTRRFINPALAGKSRPAAPVSR